MNSTLTLGLLGAALLISACGAPTTPQEEPSGGAADSTADSAAGSLAGSSDAGTAVAVGPEASPGLEPAGEAKPKDIEEPAAEGLSWSELDRRGDEHLKAGRFEEAIADFDAGAPFAGDYWLVPRYGAAWILATGDADTWVLLNAFWEAI